MLGLLKKLFAGKTTSTEVEVTPVSAPASIPPTSTVVVDDFPVEKPVAKAPAKKAAAKKPAGEKKPAVKAKSVKAKSKKQ